MSPVPDEEHDKQDGEDMENLEVPNLVIPAVIDLSEEEDEEEEGDNGYQLLPQGPDDVGENGHLEDSDEDSGMSDGEEEDGQNVAMATGLVHSGLYPNFPEGELPSYLQVPDLPRSDKKEILWNQPRTAAVDVMDLGQVASIKNAMKGFSLPDCNIPEWAQNITEDKWKEQLLSHLSSDGHTNNMSSLSRVANNETSHSSESSLSETEKETG